MSTEEIFDFYYESISYEKHKKGWVTNFVADSITPHRLDADLINAKTGEVALAAGQKITPRLAKKLASEGLDSVILPDTDLIGKYLGQDIVHPSTGEVVFSIGAEITQNIIVDIDELKIKSIKLHSNKHFNNLQCTLWQIILSCMTNAGDQ